MKLIKKQCKKLQVPYLFNAFYYKNLFNLDTGMTETQLYEHWLKHTKKDCVIPIDKSVFDEAYYLKKNLDVAEDGGWSFEHFYHFGAKEGRYPNPLFEGTRFRQFYMHYLPKVGNLNHFFICTEDVRSVYIQYVQDTEFEFKKILKLLSHISGLTFSKDELIVYLKEEKFDLPLFDESYYADNVKKLLPSSHKYDLLHWLILGRIYSISFMYIFGENEYLQMYPSLQKYSKGAFHHYIFYGIKENRSPNKIFNAKYYQDRYAPKIPAILDYYMYNSQATFSTQVIPEIIRCINRKNILEEVYSITKEAKEQLEGTILKEQLTKLSSISPDILRNSHNREIKIPFISHPDNLLYAVHKKIEDKIIQNSLYGNIDTLILIPHCRTSGAARVSGRLAMALENLSYNVMVVSTELNIIEKPEWYPKNQIFFDLSEYANQLNHDQKMRLLVGFIRGINIQNIFNVNSKLGWEVFNTFGKQLSKSRNLYSYLFCWDRDKDGYKSGYPREYFASTYPYLKNFLLDSSFLKNDLTRMYHLSASLQNKLKVCYTPIDDVDIKINIAELGALKASLTSRKKVFWAGRFDRQKRFDILIEIARKMPDVDFLVWGKKVLNDFQFDADTLPSNMIMHGEYKEITDLPLISCDAWLYTSEWDGIPTILLDIGKYGIPIVSSCVDGLTDIITEQTSWPVLNIEDIDEYVYNLHIVLQSSPDISKKTDAMRMLIRERHNVSEYEKSLKGLEI